jgi:hypothetical protein
VVESIKRSVISTSGCDGSRSIMSSHAPTRATPSSSAKCGDSTIARAQVSASV